MRLYQLSDAYARLRDLDAEDGDYAAALDEILDHIMVKLVNIGKLVREFKAEAEAIDGEIDRLSRRASALHDKAKGLMQYAQAHMEALGLEKVEGDVLTLRLQRAAPSVEVEDDYLIPSNFFRATLKMPLNEVPEGLLGQEQREVDKRAILEANKQGYDVPGTRIVQRQFLRIV